MSPTLDEVEVCDLAGFAEALSSGKAVVTCELNPPKGTELSLVFKKAEHLKDEVDAFNITDSAGSRMTMAPVAVSHLLLDRGIETILQITGRDRNRIALQSEMLAAHALGITNLLCMTGDPPGAGDHPEAKPVFDLGAVELLQAARGLSRGADFSGSELWGAPDFFPGAVANPGAPDLDTELARMGEKIEAGAMFFQTQAVYEPASFERFIRGAERFEVPVLAGLIVLKSARMARNLNANLPGVSVPDSIIREMDEAEDRRAKSAEISGRIIREVREMCAGVHIMAIGWESTIPQILENAGL